MPRHGGRRSGLRPKLRAPWPYFRLTSEPFSVGRSIHSSSIFQCPNSLPLVFHFEQTNPIQPLKLQLSYLFIFAISSAGSGLLSFSCVQRSAQSWGMQERPQKITFAEMRSAGVHGVLIYCADYKCSHYTPLWRSDGRVAATALQGTACGGL